MTVRLAGSRFVKRERGGCFSRRHGGRRWCWFLVQAELFGVGWPKHIHPSFYWWEHGTWLQRGNMNTPWNLTSKYPKWCHIFKPKVHFLLEKLSCLVSIFVILFWVYLSVLWNSGKGLDPNHGYIPLSALRENTNFPSQTSWLGVYWFGDFLTPSDVSPTKCPVILFWFDWNTRYTSRRPCEVVSFYKDVTFPRNLRLDKNRC